MNEIVLKDFRCFHEEQTARLAPLTLLVGENSTGKTSFLALIRALWDVAFGERVPDFKESPYDLGSFDEIAHHRGGRGGRASRFEAGFSIGRENPANRRMATTRAGLKRSLGISRFHVTFGQYGSGPLPVVQHIENDNAHAESRISQDGLVSITLGTSNGRWTVDSGDVGIGALISTLSSSWKRGQLDLPSLRFLIRTLPVVAKARDAHLLVDTKPLDDDDLDKVGRLAEYFLWGPPRPFANAPVRSHPRRTYDPTHAHADPEGEYVPMLLANIARQKQRAWNSLKKGLEQFGKEAGLFDEIAIKVLGGKAGGPFQVRIRKFGRPAKGPHRNIIDVGYGVSQVLPVVTELLRAERSRMFLLQQPEVHLHPSAQAALGGLFCKVADEDRQLLIETHSDHLIDRVRMDIRDGRTHLKPEDVSILYFERRNLSVTIHSLGWDANGNLVARHGSVPEGYRQFFRSERRRSLGL